MTLTLEELKEKIAERLDPDEFIELLDISTEKLVEYLSDIIEEKRDRFREIEDEDL